MTREELELDELLQANLDAITRKKTLAVCMYTGTCGYSKHNIIQIARALDMDSGSVVGALKNTLFEFIMCNREVLSMFESHLKNKLNKGL